MSPMTTEEMDRLLVYRGWRDWELAERLGLTVWAIRKWRQRNVIPREHAKTMRTWLASIRRREAGVC